MQTNPAVKQNKNIKWSESPQNQSGRKEKGLWRKGFAERQVFSSEGSAWKPHITAHHRTSTAHHHTSPHINGNSDIEV